MSKKNTTVPSTDRRLTEDLLSRRSGIRFMMLVYDTVFYLLCYAVLFLLYPSFEGPVSGTAGLLYLLLGFVLFLVFRMAFSCYRCIFRYGRTYAFSRELLASTLAAIVLVFLALVLSFLLEAVKIPVVFVISFAAMYVVVSIMARFVYYYLYRYATTAEDGLSRVIRKLLDVFAFVDFESKKPGATRSIAPKEEKDVSDPINELQKIVDHFVINGQVKTIKQINKGYVNRTYKIETISEAGHIHKYILQRINTNVFPDVPALMHNFEVTTKHLHEKLHLPGYHDRGTVQTVRPTRDGELFFRDDSGSWRMITYFDHVYSLDIPDTPEVFYYAGVSFGSFVREMADIDPREIREVIPNFHNTGSRYRDLEVAITRDPKNRVKDVEKEIAFIRARADRFSLISDALESGKIPTRICHNDCNLNNILFDMASHLPVAIIDLDTVMPSSPLYDYGDSMRIGTNTAKDDEKDLSKVSCDLGLYEQYARGYLEACGHMLTKEELELLPYSSLIITSEDGIRFLMDHINGDTYYHIYYPGQNLDRSRTQLKLVEDMEKKLPEIKAILRRIYADLGLVADIT